MPEGGEPTKDTDNFLMFSKTLTVVLLMYCFLKNTLSTRSTKEGKIVVVISSIIGKTKVNNLNNHINQNQFPWHYLIVNIPIIKVNR
jgi:hypothetical protein